jgi:tellurite resistance protein
MTSYEQIFNSKQTTEETLTPEEAVAAIAVVTALADSSIEQIDAEGLAGILWEFEVFAEYSEDEIIEIVDELIAMTEEEGIGALFKAATQALSDELVWDGFAAGVIVLLDAEKLVIPQEKQPYLKKLQQALRLEESEAQQVIQEITAAFQEVENEEDFDGEGDTLIVEDYSEEVYESPLGNFTVPIPVDSQQGGRIQSQEGVVGFSDDFGTLLRIDYYPIPPEQLEELDSTEKQEYLRSIMVDKYVPQAILQNLPDAAIKHTEYQEDGELDYYYALVDMPHGSTISQQDNNGTITRLNAYRGLVSFIQDDFLYIVSTQRSFFNGSTSDSIEEEAENIKESILEFVGTIEFT